MGRVLQAEGIAKAKAKVSEIHSENCKTFLLGNCDFG